MVDACGWKTDRRLVPEDQIEWLLSLLLKAEERRWRASISPVNSSEHDDLEQDGQSENRGCTSVDAGSHLLRHGRSIKRIHETFHLVEPSHYCVKVTANSTNPDRPSSQMRVVSTDSGSSNQGGSSHSRTSTIESQEAGGDITAKHPLFELYKNAVLCAQYPVLSVSQTASPNTPYSPVSSPPSLPLQRKFSFSRLPSSSSAPGGAKLNSGKRRTSAWSDTGCVSPEVCLPISSDVLQDLVMNVFQSGKRQHKYLCETEIPKQVPRAKEPQRFLVEELLSRLVVLERNHHPFYSVQAFMDKNAYSEWVIIEKEKIDGLIKSFWHYARPPVRELPLESPEFHKQYVELMKRLIRYESKHKEPHPVYGGAIPSAPLSSEACRLLKEFELRYGVGTLFCKISYLEYLVKYFENELWYIQHTSDSLHDVMDHVFTWPEIYVAQEFKMLLSILSNLLAKTKYALTRIRRIFPVENSPKGGVTALVTLFELTLESARQLQTEFPCVFTTLLEARQFASHLATEPTCDLLASYVKDEMVSRYERIKVIATDELRQNFSPPQLLLKLILEIHHEVNYYNTSYTQAFLRYFDMMELAAVKFYSLLMQDVEQLCQNPPRTQRRDNVDPSMLCLAFRLSKLDKEWAKYIPYSHQSWRQPFHDFALQWLDAIGHYFQRLVPQLTSRDAWEAVEVNISASRDRRQNMKPPGRPIPQGPLGTKSPSLLSLTPSQHSAFNTVGPSNGMPVKSRGKEPLKSRKDRLGSSPPIRVKSPRRRRPGVLNDSSSEEDTPSGRNVSPARSAPKSYKVNVIAQIHNMPRARDDSSSQGQPSEEGSPSGLGVNRKETQQQGSSELIKPYQEDSISHMATAQNGDEAIEEAVQSGSGTQPLEINGASPKDGMTSGSVNHTEDAENNTTSKVERPEVSTEKNHVENSGSSMKEESGVAKPLENGATPKDGQKSGSVNHTEDAGNKTTSKVEFLEGSTEENQVENSGSSLKEESCMVKPLENGKHHEGPHLGETQRDRQDNTRSKLDQLEGIIEKNEIECPGSTITGECGDVQPLVNRESSVSTITQEPQEKTFVAHSPDSEARLQDGQAGRSENHVKSVVNQPQENTEKVNGERSASGFTEVTPQDASHENGDSISERSWYSKASESRNQSTPFENDTTDGSDSDGSVHTSDSFNFIEDEGKTKLPGKARSHDGAVADSNSLSANNQCQQREGPEKETSNIRIVPEKGFQPIVPIEDEGRSLKRQDGEACQTCPARQSCFGTEENKETRQDARTVDAEGNKQNTGRKVPEQRPSAPVAIPAPRNRFLDKLRDTQSGSGGSKWSECGSFFSAVGSVDSGCTIETFRTARSGSGSSQSQKANGKDDSDHSDASRSSKDSDMPHVLPISSSFVDVLCAVNRLASFACHLCKILCPEESPQRGEPYAAAACSASEDDHLRNESLGIKRRLYHKLIQVMFSFIRLYSDNVLGMETCGLPDELLTEVLGDRVQRHVRAQRNAKHLQGCRYNPSATQCCNTVDRSGTFIPPCEGMSRIATNPGEFEPLTQQMGVRMSNVAVLRNILAWLLNHVTSAISNPDACSTEYELSLSYCENGPSLDSISISSTGEGRSDAPQPRTADVLHDPGVLNDFTEHFCRLEISQVKLVTYRINKLFKQVLRSLLNLRLPGFTIRKRLTPAMELLSRELQRFHSILYPDNFTKIMTDLWAAVARNFEEESNRLVRRKSSATQQSQLLLQAVAFLMQFFHGGGDGLAYDTLAAPIDPTVQYLQLYTNPTDRLISMYHSLYKQVLIMQQQYRNDEFTSSVSVSSHQASANAPADFVIQAMLRDLHVTRKCFSGAALVKWIENYVRDNGYDNLGVCIGSTETETGEDVGQYLLERGMLVCVSPPPRFDRQQSADRTRLEQSHEEKSPKERGTVFVRENVKPEIRVNGIEASSSRSSRSSPACSSRATSSRSTPADSTNSDEADDECDDDDDDFLGSASDVWSRANSRLSERDATFNNHPKAFYKFICEEDSSRTEVKISLGITDRLNLPVKLKHILCVLYSRKNSDKTARNFLKRLPGGLLEDAVGREGEGVQCYPLRGICQTL